MGSERDRFGHLKERPSGRINAVLSNEHQTVEQIAAKCQLEETALNGTWRKEARYKAIAEVKGWAVARVQYHLDEWTSEDKKKTALGSVLRCENERYWITGS
jgi:hypothetical protein